MPLDNDANSWLGYLLGILGFGGWGYKSITHGSRIKTLEENDKLRSGKLDELSEGVHEMKGELKGIASGVEEIRSWIMGKAK